MLYTYSRRSAVIRWSTCFALVMAMAAVGSTKADAQVLVGNPYITSYQNWIDPDQARNGNWRLSLHNPTLMETSDVVPAGSNPPAATNNGSYNPSLLIQDDYTTPANYDLTARMYTSDDDGFGLIFGYQNINNYYRVFFRAQGTGPGGSGNLGGTPGTSIQKVVNGVVTQISPNGTGLGNTVFPTLPANDANSPVIDRDPIDARVSVNGTTVNVYVAGVNGDLPLATVTDAGILPGKIGIQSWAQRQFTATGISNPPHWGTEVESVAVKQGVNTLYSGSFTAASLPVKWRPLVMTNSDGQAMNATGVGEDIGNWGVDINNPWIYQQTNGFEYATATTPNVDFLSTAVVVDNPGSASMGNYEMRVRIGATDDDGLGVIVRAQDNNNFYRINFSRQTITDAVNSRAPQGLSIQKVRNGVWSELYRDNQTTPLFIYQNGPGTPASGQPGFDLKVGVVNDQIKVTVTDHNGNVIRYPVVTDSSDPILAGSAGFHTWGTDNVYFSSFRNEGGPLVSALSAFTEFNVTIDRTNGNVTLTNNSPAATNIEAISLTSAGGALNSANWLSVANNYDRPSPPTPGNGSVDPDDAWTIGTSTVFNLSESELAGNGGTLTVGQTVNLGNLWTKSRIQDVGLTITLADGTTAIGEVSYTGTAYSRSDLNTDGSVNANDWPFFYPNMLANLSSLSTVGKALAGDLDGDGDNDVNDFALFKADWDMVNGAGSFDAFLAGVPEPSTMLLATLGLVGLGLRRRRATKPLPATFAALGLAVIVTSSASAVPVDLTTFTTEAFPPAASFGIPAWTVTPTSASHPSNQDASILYSPDSALNKRYIGRLTPGTDDDVVGFVLGFTPGNTAIGATGQYILIDWKGASQDFDFADGDFNNTFHDTTGTGNMPVGLALSRVTNSPTADELWQHADLTPAVGPDYGGVAQLVRGATLGSTAYNRANGTHVFDITYTATNIKVLVDGVQQFNLNGAFGDGRFGLYSAWQGPTETFSNFEVFPSDFGLSATVDRGNGIITLKNTSTVAVDFDFYQLDSLSNSLKPGTWNSLSEQNYQSVGAGPGQSWDEAGGSSTASLAEVFLQSNSSLAPGASVPIGEAYNNILNGEDIVLKFRTPNGSILGGVVNYIGTPPVGIPGDYNSDGKVDARDYVIWRRDPGAHGGPGGYNTWRANFGTGTGSGSALGGSAGVPEPGTIGLLACIGLLWVRSRRTSG